MKNLLLTALFVFFSIKVFADEKMILGLEVYNEKAMCGTCHALRAAGSDGQIGPDLDQLKPKKEQIIYTVSNGIGVMPAFQDMLTPEEIEAVAYYIFNSTKNN